VLAGGLLIIEKLSSKVVYFVDNIIGLLKIPLKGT
jgi:hypothetical protein